MSDKTIGDDPIKDFIESIQDDAFYEPINSPYQQYFDERSPNPFGSHDDDYDGKSLSPGLDDIRQYVLRESKNSHATVLTNSFRPENNYTLHQTVHQCTADMESLLPFEQEKYPTVRLTLHAEDENYLEFMALMTSWDKSQCNITLAEYLYNDSAYIIKIYITYNQQKEIEGYIISTYLTNKSIPTNLSVLVIDLIDKKYHYIYRYQNGLSQMDEIEKLLNAPSQVIHAIRSTNWTKHTRSSH